MELVKNKLSTTILKTSKYSQFTINDDFKDVYKRQIRDNTTMTRNGM